MNNDIDIFALHALTVVANQMLLSGSTNYSPSEVAADAYRIARAMVRESKEHQEIKTP